MYGGSSTLVFVGIVVACLWPFQSPPNQVAWLDHGNGVRFGDYGTIVSRGAVMPEWPVSNSWTLEIWLRPEKAYESDTILAFYNPQRPRGFSLTQWNTDVVVQNKSWSKEYEPGGREPWGRHTLQGTHVVFLSLASGPEGTSAYIDGNLVSVAREFRLPASGLSGQLVVANSPVDNDGWSGDLRGLALYSRELTEAQIFRHYATWTRTGRPDVAPGEGAVALYLFNEHSGDVIHNQVRSGANLYIPGRFLEVHQALLKRPWNEYRSDWGYWKNILINVAGFVPLGFFLYGYLSLGLGIRHAVLITILAGALLSLTMETLQSFLPTRDSGMTDIITNTLGTALGAALCRWVSILSERFADSHHAGIRLLAGLLSRHEQEPAAPEPASVLQRE